MGHTDNDGQVAGAEAAEALPPVDPASPAAQPNEPFTGFDADGYFVVRIHPSLGYHALQGHLLEAQVWLRGITLRQQRKEVEAAALKAEASRLIRPGGRFNAR